MKEIEAKILEIDRKKIEETLSTLGAKKIFDGEIETICRHRIPAGSSPIE